MIEKTVIKTSFKPALGLILSSILLSPPSAMAEATPTAPPADYTIYISPLILMFIVGTMAVQLGGKMILDHKPRFGSAFLLNASVSIAAILVVIAFLFVMGNREGSEMLLVLILTYTVVGTFVFGWGITRPERGEGSQMAAIGIDRGFILAIISVFVNVLASSPWLLFSL